MAIFQLVLFYLLPSIIGFRFGGIFGVITILICGHLIRKFLFNTSSAVFINVEKTKQVFYTSTFAIMGYISKVDGVVSKNEIDCTNILFDRLELDGEQKKNAVDNFNRGKSDDFDLEEELEIVSKYCSIPSSIKMMFAEIQVMISCVDGVPCAKEKEVLSKIYSALSIDEYILEEAIAVAIASQEQGQDSHNKQNSTSSPKSIVENARIVLGVSDKSTLKEIKKAYKLKMIKYHPDKLIAKGMPKEMIDVATKKAKEISAAYEVLKNTKT
jgi:DnaJ like chaperone protein